ncbi:unnamed protein product [Nippostrongylus brasiliensis]|uniref:Protein kinase domain-containing protein n=1 Tax=Nippostrongylus brasiliensis TaxID=27835 RepID=A0A0N4YZH7_NIPBR|nr:unnamed protein product [Nippostrongylus brasiliensis]
MVHLRLPVSNLSLQEKALETEETMSLVSKSIEAFHADEVEEKGGVTLELPEKSTRSQKTDVVVSMDTAFERKLAACLTVRWEGKTMDFPIHTLLTENQGHTFTLDGKRTSNDIMGLVKSHYRLQQDINGVMLKNPVMKAQWELTKNKITLVKKIGAGQGGEVWQGTLREASNKPPIDVAIKMVSGFSIFDHDTPLFNFDLTLFSFSHLEVSVVRSKCVALSFPA